MGERGPWEAGATRRVPRPCRVSCSTLTDLTRRGPRVLDSESRVEDSRLKEKHTHAFGETPHETGTLICGPPNSFDALQSRHYGNIVPLQEFKDSSLGGAPGTSHPRCPGSFTESQPAGTSAVYRGSSSIGPPGWPRSDQMLGVTSTRMDILPRPLGLLFVG